MSIVEEIQTQDAPAHILRRRTRRRRQNVSWNMLSASRFKTLIIICDALGCIYIIYDSDYVGDNVDNDDGSDRESD